MPDERRKEPRYATEDSVEVRVLANGGRPFTAIVVNVSRAGLRLQLGIDIPVGTTAEAVTQGKFAAVGQVRYCVRRAGRCYAGVEVQDTIVPPTEAKWHMNDDQLALYAIGRNLKASEFFRAMKHLEECLDCNLRLAEHIGTGRTLLP